MTQMGLTPIELAVLIHLNDISRFPARPRSGGRIIEKNQILFRVLIRFIWNRSLVFICGNQNLLLSVFDSKPLSSNGS